MAFARTHTHARTISIEFLEVSLGSLAHAPRMRPDTPSALQCEEGSAGLQKYAMRLSHRVARMSHSPTSFPPGPPTTKKKISSESKARKKREREKKPERSSELPLALCR